MAIAVIDYGIGNLNSVLNALNSVGAETRLVSNAEQLADHDAVVLPGVGAFAVGMANLAERGLVEAIRKEVRAGTPFLGFCLGLQLLAEASEEHGHHEGLGLVKGTVRKLSPDPLLHLRLPHIGWNDVTFTRSSSTFGDAGNSACYYFVHSYALDVTDENIIVGMCDYGGPFVAAIQVGNITATQFHPEKSHKAGLQLLRNWLDTTC